MDISSTVANLLRRRVYKPRSDIPKWVGGGAVSAESMHLAWRYSVEIPLRRINVDKKLVEEYKKRFRSGESIDKMFIYITMLRNIAEKIEAVSMKKLDVLTSDEPRSIYRELAMCICGLCDDAEHGKLSGRPFTFFKPYKLYEGCTYLKTIVAGTIVCCEINESCRECVEIAKQLINNYISGLIMYPTKIRFGIFRDKLIIDLEVYESVERNE